MKLKCTVAYDDHIPGDVFVEMETHAILQALNTRRAEKMADDAKLVRVPRPETETEKLHKDTQNLNTELQKENAALREQVAALTTRKEKQK